MMLPFAFSSFFSFICVFFSIAGAFSLARIVFCLRRFGGRRLAILLQDASIRFLLFFFICGFFSIAGAFSLARIVFCLRRFGGRRLVILLHDASLRFLLLFSFICGFFSM